MGVYIANDTVKPRAPQKNNRHEVKDSELGDAYPGAKCVRLMTDEELMKWGTMLPSQLSKEVMHEMK